MHGRPVGTAANVYRDRPVWRVGVHHEPPCMRTCDVAGERMPLCSDGGLPGLCTGGRRRRLRSPVRVPIQHPARRAPSSALPLSLFGGLVVW